MFVQFTCISFDFLRNCLDQYIYSLVPRSSHPSFCRLGKKGLGRRPVYNETVYPQLVVCFLSTNIISQFVV